MRSFDQFSNMVLENTFERHVVGGKSKRERDMKNRMEVVN